MLPSIKTKPQRYSSNTIQRLLEERMHSYRPLSNHTVFVLQVAVCINLRLKLIDSQLIYLNCDSGGLRYLEYSVG